MRKSLMVMGVWLALAWASPAMAQQVPPSGVIGVTDEAMLTPAFWVARAVEPERVLLDAGAIEIRNARLLAIDPSMHDLRALPATLTHDQVTTWINGISQLPTKPLYDEHGQRVSPTALDQLKDALALDRIPASQPVRYGLVVRRAALRAFPTSLRVFTRLHDTDIDRFQETAEFPGTPVVIAHASRDGRWLFVVSPRYAAWTLADNVAEGSAREVLGYAGKSPFRVITGDTARTVYTPEQPAVSELPLDMGVQVPLADVPADQPVNGESPYAAHVIQLPIRKPDGRLSIVPALLPKRAESAGENLPLTRANIIRQAFRFLGERYGWGHDYDGRDCSGFVSDVYRSMGVEMPRDTGKQESSPVFVHRLFTAVDGHAARLQAVRALRPGDLVYIPGHVMMVIGQLEGEPWVIHDTTGIRYRDGSKLRTVVLNGVSVTPLPPLLLDDNRSYVDEMTGIVKPAENP